MCSFAASCSRLLKNSGTPAIESPDLDPGSPLALAAPDRILLVRDPIAVEAQSPQEASVKEGTVFDDSPSLTWVEVTGQVRGLTGSAVNYEGLFGRDIGRFLFGF
jgi:hypothetical protein